MRNKEQLLKMISKLQSLSSRLHEEKSIGIHQNINHFYYMQKIEELKFLLVKFDDLNLQMVKLTEMAENEYAKVFCQWKKDIRFINSYHRDRLRDASVL